MLQGLQQPGGAGGAGLLRVEKCCESERRKKGTTAKGFGAESART